MGDRRSEPVLELTGAGFHHRGARSAALVGVDLRIAPGEMVAVLGPQGSGTSTLSRLAAGLLEDRGRVSGTRTAAAGSGVVMLGDDPEAQQTGMTSYVRDELRLPGRLRGRESHSEPGAGTGACDHAAEAALADLGGAHLLDRRLDSLSGGERQIVALAGLLGLRPALLVLDQPGLSLDAAARTRLLHGLRQYCAEGGAVLIAGHQEDELSAACERRAFLREGQLVELPAGEASSADDGTLEEFGVWSSLPGQTQAQPMSSSPGQARDAGLGSRGSDASEVAESAGPAGSAGSAEAAGQTAPSAVDAVRPVLTVEELSVSRGGTPTLEDFRLSLAPAEIVTLEGANGSGKSTLLRALAGLLGRDADVSGRICSAELALDELPAHRRAGTLAWVGQDPSAQLSASTVRAELERSVPLPRHRRRDRAAVRAARDGVVTELLHRTGLSEAAQSHPYDLSPARQKDLVIATALLLRPQVLLLDEPTLGRDHPGMQRLTGLLRDVAAAGAAVLTTTHDLAWAEQVAQRRVRLDSTHDHSSTHRPRTTAETDPPEPKGP